MKTPKKGSVALVFFGIFCAVCLVGLAAFVTVVLDTDHLIPLAPADTGVSSGGQPLAAKTSVSESPSVLFVGDSRTAGMRNALASLGSADDACSFIAKDGEGYYWLRDTALPELTAYLDSAPDTVVVTNMGVNDLTDSSAYISLYRDLMNRYPDTPFYILSVNPAGDDCSSVSNNEIEAFNARMAQEFPDCYLDCYDYLKKDGYETYQKIHDYVVSSLENGT